MIRKQHLGKVTRRPALAQDTPVTIGEILTVVVQMMTVLVTALAAKEASTS